MSNSVPPHRWQPTSLCRPWDSPGKNTGVGCHFLLQCMKVKSESKVTQSCPTLCNPMDCSPPGSSIHGIFQARVLEWGAIAFSDEKKLGILILWIRRLYIVKISVSPNQFIQASLQSHSNYKQSFLSIHCFLKFIFNWGIIALQYSVICFCCTTM